MSDAFSRDFDEEEAGHPDDDEGHPENQEGNLGSNPTSKASFNLPTAVLPHARDEGQHTKLMQWIDSINIADHIDDDTLQAIGQRVKKDWEIDDKSRTTWLDKTKQAMDLAMQVAETKTYPWPKASNVIYPLMTVAAIQFAARAYPAIVSGRNVVKGVVVGPDDGVPMIDPQSGQPLPNPQTGQPAWQVPPGALRDRAAKIGQHMSWQLLDEQPEWEEETDRLLHILPIVGCCFRKTYFDPAKQRNVDVLVPAARVVINYWAKSTETAPRLTEELMLYPLEISEFERAGVFLEVDYTTETPHTTDNKMPNDPQDDDAPRMFLEQHRWWDLDEDGFPEPYVITTHKDTSKVVRIVARYDHDGVKFRAKDGKVAKIDAVHYYTKFDFLPNPDGGIYGVGFGQLLRPVNEAVNTTLNMMIDAGHMQVVGGGFIGKGLSMHTGNVRFVPGEYKAVNSTGAAIKDNIVPLNPPGASPVLFQLLGQLIEAGKEISSVKDVLTGDQQQGNVPATTTLALIEQGLKTFTAIYKRVHRALKKELEKLYRLNSLYLPENAGYRANNQWRTISRQDYQLGSGVEPVSDPSMVSDMQRMARAQFLQGYQNDPMCQGLEIRRRIFSAAMIEKIDDLLLSQPPPNPELVAKAAELETRQERTRAEATRDYAQAILALAQAAKLEGDAKLDWIDRQLEVFRARMESLTSDKDSDSSGSNGGGPAELAPPPSDPGSAPIPSGLQPGAAAGGVAALASGVHTGGLSAATGGQGPGGGGAQGPAV